MLLREKALLFKDYVQPYHFLTKEKERPDTSAESIYGSTVTSYPNTSEPSTQTTPRRKRSYQPRPKREKSPLPKSIYNDKNRTPEKSDSSESSPESTRREPYRLRRRPPNSDDDSPISDRRNDRVMPTNLNEATSMEWDPYLENKQKTGNRRNKANARRRRRNISPISEEDEDNNKPTTSIDAQNGSDVIDSASSEGSSYTESAPNSERTITSSDIRSPNTTRGQTTTDFNSTTQTSGKTGTTRSPTSSTEDSSRDPRYTNNR